MRLTPKRGQGRKKSGLMMTFLEELLLSLLAWLLLAGCTAIPVIVCWVLFVRNRPHYLQDLRPVRWSGFEVCLAFFVGVVLIPGLVGSVLRQTHLVEIVYGPPVSADSEVERIRENLWTMLAAYPLEMTLIPLLLRLASGTRLFDLGLTLYRGGANVVVGWLAWILVTPFVYVFNVLVASALWRLTDTPPDVHPITKLAEDHPLMVDWLLIVASAMLFAPMTEELLFRGVLQTWLIRRPWGAHMTMAISFVLAPLMRLLSVKDSQWDGSTAVELLPVAIFALVTLPGYLLCGRLAGRWFSVSAVRAIYAASLLFATFHAGVWPTPVPLFFLGLGLGFIAYRTQSLVAPIVFHSLFNGMTCLILILSRPASGWQL
jgi:membrane protease YdiL (CAAX protease family)